jgi:hypothetical protein
VRVGSIVRASVQQGRGGRITGVEELHVIGAKDVMHEGHRNSAEKKEKRESIFGACLEMRTEEEKQGLTQDRRGLWHERLKVVTSKSR